VGPLLIFSHRRLRRAALLTRSLTVIAFAVLALEGCSKPWRKYGEPLPIIPDKWQHETKTLNDFDRDVYECRRDNPSTAGRQVASEMRDRCMLTKGWTRR
jgi:hypothetical protein